MPFFAIYFPKVYTFFIIILKEILSTIPITMRDVIYPQILNYKKQQNILLCKLCKNADDLQVDHYKKHFIDLFFEFINSQKYIPQTFEDNKCHMKIFSKKDKSVDNEIPKV